MVVNLLLFDELGEVLKMVKQAQFKSVERE